MNKKQRDKIRKRTGWKRKQEADKKAGVFRRATVVVTKE